MKKTHKVEIFELFDRQFRCQIKAYFHPKTASVPQNACGQQNQLLLYCSRVLNIKNIEVSTKIASENQQL